MNNSIYIIAHGDNGSKYGLGHIYRTIKIYDYIRTNFPKIKCNFISKNKIGINVLENITKSKVINQKNFLKDNFIICQRDIFIIDNLGIDKIIIKKLEYFNIHKIISFDDLNFTLSSGTIINGILFTKKILYPKKNINIYQGLKYFIINSEYKKKEPKKKFSGNIIISTGGSDLRFLLYDLSKILIKYNFNIIYVIFGNGCSSNHPIIKLSKKNKNINLIKNKSSLKYYFDRSDFSIVTGGIVMFESIASCTPTYVIQNYQHQKYAIDFFSNKKFVKKLGSYNNYKRNLNNFLKNKPDHLIKNFDLKKMKYCIDGYGLYRVEKIIKKMILK